MSFEPDTLTLGEERNRLDSELDELVENLADADDDAAGTSMLVREARDLDQAGQAVSALVDEYGDDAEVRVRGLSAGAYAEMEDRLDEERDALGVSGNAGGLARNVYAASGLVDAPFLDEFDPKESDDIDEFRHKLLAIAEQSVGVAKWLESLVDERTRADSGNWQPLADRLAETGGG